MREIIFRGKCSDGRWIYGWYSKYNGIPTITDSYGEIHRVDSATVGQFTGLFDQNGTRIYEGDVITDRTTKYTTGAIYYGSGNIDCIECCGGVYGFYSKENADLRRAKDCVVIGNIHDNPDLLKGETPNG